MASQDSCSSSACSSVIDGDSADETTMDDCLGTQPYLFEPYDSDPSTDRRRSTIRAIAKHRLVSVQSTSL